VKYLLCFVNCYICKIRRSAVKFLIFPHWFYNFRSPTTFSGRKTPKSGRKMSKTEIWISNRFPIGKSGKKRKTGNFPFPGTSGKSFSVGKVNPGMAIFSLANKVDFSVKKKEKKTYSQGPHQYETFLLFCFQCQHPSVPPVTLKCSKSNSVNADY